MGLKTYPTILPEQRTTMSDIGQSYSQLAGSATNFLQGMGESSAQIVKDWQSNFATPVMNMWRETIAPIVKEGFNLPGSFYSRSTSLGLQRAGESFFSGSVMPTLFSALENMRNRMPQYGQIYAGVLGQGAGFSTASTQGAFYKDKSWRQDLKMDIENYGSLAADIGTMGFGQTGMQSFGQTGFFGAK